MKSHRNPSLWRPLSLTGCVSHHAFRLPQLGVGVFTNTSVGPRFRTQKKTATHVDNINRQCTQSFKNRNAKSKKQKLPEQENNTSWWCPTLVGTRTRSDEKLNDCGRFSSKHRAAEEQARLLTSSPGAHTTQHHHEPRPSCAWHLCSKNKPGKGSNKALRSTKKTTRARRQEKDTAVAGTLLLHPSPIGFLVSLVCFLP